MTIGQAFRMLIRWHRRSLAVHSLQQVLANDLP
jgi:hypothetical protein